MGVVVSCWICSAESPPLGGASFSLERHSRVFVSASADSIEILLASVAVARRNASAVGP
jgi:hypothetical protein